MRWRASRVKFCNKIVFGPLKVDELQFFGSYDPNGMASTLLDRFKRPINYISIVPEIQFLKCITVDFLSMIIQRRMGMERVKNVWANYTRSSGRNEVLKKPISKELNMLSAKQVDESGKTLDRSGAEFEPVLMQGVGWAGQPIVKRVHPILPEVYGDIADTPLTNFLKNMRGHEKSLSNSFTTNVSETKAQKSYIKPATQDVSLKIGGYKERNAIKLSTLNSVSTKKNQIEEKQDKVIENVVTDQNILKNKSLQDKNISLKKTKSPVFRSEPLLMKKNMRTKKKPKTTVCTAKPSNVLKVKKSKNLNKKKGNFKVSGLTKKNIFHSKLPLNKASSMQPLHKTVMRMENRQFKTFAPVGAIVALKVNVKEKSVLVTEKKQTKKKMFNKGSFPDDCKCPETLEVKTKVQTKICGEAAGVEEKKKKKDYKGKMCRIERQIKHKTKTVVCAPTGKFAKSKRKRQLPKCEKPEKKVAPRVEVCPPILHEELAKGEKKKCVKEVEEIKIKKRTKVCKPVIIYGKEEAEVKIEKKVCTERKVQKKISRHTTVCAPAGASVEKKKPKH